MKDENDEKIGNDENEEIEELTKVYDNLDNTENLDTDSALIDDIVDDITEKTPDVSEHVIENDSLINENSPVSPVNSNTSGTFDSSIHRSDENGNPILTKLGKYAKKRGKAKSKVEVPNFKAKLKAGSTEQNKSFSKIGTLSASHVRDMLGGEKATPEEREYLEIALLSWLNDTEIKVSPSITLIIVMGTFFMPLVKLPFEKNVLLQTAVMIKTKISGS